MSATLDNAPPRSDGSDCTESAGNAEQVAAPSATQAQARGRKSLLESLVCTYDELRTKLAARLGCAALAEDVLQETYMRLADKPEREPVQQPRAYLMRMAVNLAIDRRRAEGRYLSGDQVQSLLDINLDERTPESLAESRSEVAALEWALRDLPARRREILLASRLEETPHRQIAARFGVSTRTIEIELKRALEHCSQRLGRRAIQRFGPGAGESSES